MTSPTPWLSTWQAGFGRSPECHSYLDLLHKVGDEGLWTFSECVGKQSVVTGTETGALPPQVPPFVANVGYFAYWECCGGCHLDTPEVRLYYFEETGASNCSSNLSTTVAPIVTSKGNTTQEMRPIAPRVVSVPPDGSLAVIRGETL